MRKIPQFYIHQHPFTQPKLPFTKCRRAGQEDEYKLPLVRKINPPSEIELSYIQINFEMKLSFMRKIIVFTCLVCVYSVNAKAQLVINNATLFIQSGATVTVQGDLTSNVDIQGTGLLQLKGTSLQNVDMGGNTIPNLELDNTAGATLLNTNTRIGTSMLFTNGNFQLGNFNMLIAPGATLTNFNNARFFMTNGTGVLTRQSMGAASFIYPVGFSSTEYNPLTMSNSGTVDDISVRCLQNVLTNGLSGSPVTAGFANNSWVVSEAVAGGSNLSLTGEWVPGDELAGFNRNKCGIARYNTGTDWDLPASNVIVASGANPYNRSRSSITSFSGSGVFAAADLGQVNTALLNLKVFLQGPFNSGLGVMNDGLRSSNVIPLTQPYSAALNAFYNRTGSVYDGSAGVNENVPSSAVFDVAGTNDDIVDWVFISLQDGTTPATRLQTKVGLIQRDGDIVQYDPVTLTYGPVKMPIDADGNYHLVVSHRNHLAIRTPASQLLQDGVTFSYNFTTAQSQAYQNPGILTNPAMKDLGSGRFALWGGDGTKNGIVNYTPIGNDEAFLKAALGGILSSSASGYLDADFNMNGVVNYTPLGNDEAFLKAVLGGVLSNSVSRHL